MAGAHKSHHALIFTPLPGDFIASLVACIGFSACTGLPIPKGPLFRTSTRITSRPCIPGRAQRARADVHGGTSTWKIAHAVGMGGYCSRSGRSVERCTHDILFNTMTLSSCGRRCVHQIAAVAGVEARARLPLLPDHEARVVVALAAVGPV